MPNANLAYGYGPHGIVSGAELTGTFVVLALGLIAIAIMAFRTRTHPV